jgi:[ribosomal protein S18]-alanine N-acetyltransferase
MFGWFEKPSSPPTIRRIGSDFGSECAKIHALSFAHPWAAAEFESLLAGRDVIGQAAIAAALWRKNGKGLTAFVLSRCALDTAEILTIAVAPPARGKGIASALLANHLAALAAKGAKTLFLEVEADNRAALSLYQRFDFRQVGEREAYYRKSDGTHAEALILSRELD